MKIFVLNLSDEAIEEVLYQAFKRPSQVGSINGERDEVAAKTRGLGFVIMSSVTKDQMP